MLRRSQFCRERSELSEISKTLNRDVVSAFLVQICYPTQVCSVQVQIDQIAGYVWETYSATFQRFGGPTVGCAFENTAFTVAFVMTLQNTLVAASHKLFGFNQLSANEGKRRRIWTYYFVEVWIDFFGRDLRFPHQLPAKGVI